jgi:hypothetical protein
MGGPSPRNRSSSRLKVKGRREDVEDVIKVGTSDSISKQKVALANRFGGSVDVKIPSRVG